MSNIIIIITRKLHRNDRTQKIIKKSYECSDQKIVSMIHTDALATAVRITRQGQ